MADVLDFGEIRRMAKEQYGAEDEPFYEKQKRMCDWMEEMLIDCYVAGLTGTGLPVDPVMDSEHLRKDVLNKKIDGITYRERLIEHLISGNEGLVENLAESEAHRVFETGKYDTAKECERVHGGPENKRQGVSAWKQESVVRKKWNTMRDPKVRDTHDYIEGVEIPLDAEFITFDGDFAQYPGNFKKARNNANCRCWLTYVFRPRV